MSDVVLLLLLQQLNGSLPMALTTPLHGSPVMVQPGNQSKASASSGHAKWHNVGDEDLEFVCVSMPPWPGNEEA